MDPSVRLSRPDLKIGGKGTRRPSTKGVAASRTFGGANGGFPSPILIGGFPQPPKGNLAPAPSTSIVSCPPPRPGTKKGPPSPVLPAWRPLKGAGPWSASYLTPPGTADKCEEKVGKEAPPATRGAGRHPVVLNPLGGRGQPPRHRCTFLHSIPLPFVHRASLVYSCHCGKKFWGVKRLETLCPTPEGYASL